MKISSNIQLDNPSHTFVIAEAGSNWKAGDANADLKRAKELIHTASRCGADAIKFQVYRASTVYVPNAGDVDSLTKGVDRQNIYEIFDKFSMPYEMIQELSEECVNENIIFMSTAFSVKDAEVVDKYVPIHKVASYEINHIRLLEFLAKTKKPIILSTGASTYEEIDFAVDFLKKNGAYSIALLQCTAVYPAPFHSLNLSSIPEMKKRYGIPIGFSDHSLDPLVAPLVSLSYGATIIEKHFTLSKSFEGPDHSFALEPEELNLMIKAIRNAEKAKGDGNKIVFKEEEELRHFATRSIQAITDIKNGEILQEGVNFDVLRPGKRKKGIEPRFLLEVNGKKSKKDVKKGDGIIDFE